MVYVQGAEADWGLIVPHQQMRIGEQFVKFKCLPFQVVLVMMFSPSVDRWSEGDKNAPSWRTPSPALLVATNTGRR
jgi:hypothetical protein